MKFPYDERAEPGIAARAVVLCGGSGSRLWPLSRAAYPKQFLGLIAPQSLLQQTLARLQWSEREAEAAGLRLGSPIVVTHEAQRFLTAQQVRDAGIEQAEIVLEPAGRNTAPALAAAALLASAKAQADPVLIVSAADHAIADEPAFRAALLRAVALAADGAVVTFGVVPTQPHSGYGYLDVQTVSDDATAPRRLKRFVEKPSAAVAADYVAAGMLWNSGMFVLRARVALALLERFAAPIVAAVRAACADARTDLDFVRLGRDAFVACPSDSIDYALMEPLTQQAEAGAADLPPAWVVPLDAGWSDIGSFDALWERLPHDAHGNALQGNVYVDADTRDCLVVADERLVVAAGVNGLVVVDTPDALLVLPRARAQQVKDLVAALQRQGRSEAQAHRKAHRPWGWYDRIDAGDRFQVKRIVVRPGASLSLQMHHHRAEHWVVVRGTASVTRGDEQFLLTENQSTYIPLGVRHRLANPGRTDLEIIEIQSGTYLGEDDIVRFDDAYGRAAQDLASEDRSSLTAGVHHG